MENENSLQAPKEYCSLNPNLSVAMATSASVCAAQLSLIFGGGIPAGSDLLWYCVSNRTVKMISGLCVFLYV